MIGSIVRPRRGRVAVVGLTVTGLVTLMLASGCAKKAQSSGSGALGGIATGASAVSPGASPSGAAGASGGPSTHPTTPAPHTTAPVTHAYPSDYARAILTAWSSGDGAYLALLTNATIAHQIHTFGHINQHWTHISNDGASGSVYASFYNNAGDEITLRLVNSELSLHHWHAGSVQTWDPMTFPSGATAYTKKYVDAWIAGNPARMNLLGPTALSGIYLSLSTPSSSYTLDPPFSTSATEVEVEIKDTSTSLDTSVIINTTKLGHAHAIGGCDIGC